MILKKRTLDFYCKEEIDPYVWLPSITHHLQGQYVDKKVPISFYSPGKALWKRMLLKLQYIYIKPNKKKSKQKYHNANAYAIIQFGKSNMKIDLDLFNKKKF